MDYPKSVLDIVKGADEKYPSDIAKAAASAEKKIRALPEFEDLIGLLIYQAVKDLIYQVRGAQNRQIKTSARGFHSIPKVQVGNSSSVLEVAQSVYALRIAGQTLGMIQGSQLEALAIAEEQVGAGHLKNAALLRTLREIVPENKTVRQAIREDRLAKILVEAGITYTPKTPALVG